VIWEEIIGEEKIKGDNKMEGVKDVESKS